MGPREDSPDQARAVAEAYERALGGVAEALHDGPMQALTSTSRVLELLDRVDDATRERLQESTGRQVRDAIRAMRAIMDELLSGGAGRISLAGALRQAIPGVTVDEQGAASRHVGESLAARGLVRALCWLSTASQSPAHVVLACPGDVVCARWSVQEHVSPPGAARLSCVTEQTLNDVGVLVEAVGGTMRHGRDGKTGDIEWVELDVPAQ